MIWLRNIHDMFLMISGSMIPGVQWCHLHVNAGKAVPWKSAALSLVISDDYVSDKE